MMNKEVRKEKPTLKPSESFAETETNESTLEVGHINRMQNCGTTSRLEFQIAHLLYRVCH